MKRWIVLGFGLGLLCLACGFRPAVQGDGVNYFAYLHSLVVDRDLDFRNEYAAADAARLPVDRTLVGTPTRTGLVANFQPVGSAILALPFYLGALALRPGGEPPFAGVYVTAFTLASLLYGLLALALAARLAAGAAGSWPAAVTGALIAALTTPLAFYLLYEPSYSHTFSAFAATAFVLVWWRGRDGRSAGGWLALGLLGGLMGLIRIQDAPLAAIALLDLPRARWRMWPFLPGFALALAPQVLVGHALYGTWLPYRPPGYELSAWPGHYVDVLLSSHFGLLTWSPVFLPAAIGLALTRHRRLALAGLVAFLLELAITGAAPDWWGGLSFGMRRFLDLLPFVVVGLAELVRRLRPWTWAPAAALLSVWSLLLASNLLYVIRTDHDPGYASLLAGQLAALPDVPRLFVQGAVVRSLVLWLPLREPFQPVPALALLALEAACLAAAMWTARPGRSRRDRRLTDATGALSGASRPWSAARWPRWRGRPPG